MTLIDPHHPSLRDDPKQFWKDELANTKIILYETEKAIIYLLNHKMGRYTIDTGQDSQTVQYQELDRLYMNKKNLIKQINEIETYLGVNGHSINQVVPGW